MYIHILLSFASFGGKKGKMGGKERGAKSFVPFVKIENTAVTALLRTRRVYRSNVPRNNIGCDAGN